MGRYLLLAVTLAACYDPTVPQGVVCTVPDGICPPGQTCGADGLCSTNGSPPAPVPDASLPGAPPPDAPDGGASSSLPAWHLVQAQAAANGNLGGLASLAATLTATMAGDLLVVGVQVAHGGTITSVTDNAPGGTSTFTAIPGSEATNTQGDGGIELWYTPSLNAGATAVTATATTSGASIYTVVAWEVATAQPATVDTVMELSNQASSTTLTAPAVTTQAPGELVIAIGIAANDVNALAAGSEFTNDTLANGNGWAHITSTTAAAGAHQAVWDTSAGTSCSTAVAFHVGE